MIVREIGYIIVMAGILGIIFRLLKQPTILAYILAGVIVGPLGFKLVVHQQAIAELSELAIVVMLFVIGIEMDLSRLKKVGMVAILGGAIQVITTFILGFFVSKAFGQTDIASSYLGFALAFSSTMLVVKILGEKYDMETLYGRIVVGILIMQDLFAIFALSIFSSRGDGFSFGSLLSTLTLAAGLILIVVFVCGKMILPRLFKYAASEREVLFLVTMATLFIVAFYAENQKLSMGIGSFLAGLAVAELSYKYEIIGDMKSLKSFFTILFFAALGLQLAPIAAVSPDGLVSVVGIPGFLNAMWSNIGIIICFLFLTVIGKPVLTTVIVKMFGYQKTVAVNSGLALGQLSEFGLVMIAQGIVAGCIDASLLSPLIVVTVLSMVLSSYMMYANLQINRFLARYNGWLEHISWVQAKFDFPADAKDNFTVLLVGRDKLGRIIEGALSKLKIRYVVVDSNPDVIAKLREKETPFIFGDINNHEVLDQLDFLKINTVFSTIPDTRDNQLLLTHIGKNNPNVNFIGIVDTRSKAEELYGLGAHYVLVTYMLAGAQLIHNRASTECGINLKSILEDLEGVRVRGQRHRAGLYQEFEPADFLEEEPTSP